MRTHITLLALRTQARLVLLVTTAVAWLTNPVPHRTRAKVENGSETTEKAVITAIALGLAVGLGAAISAVVHKYQGQIH